MSDQIAVMSDGVVEQVGTAREVYDEPTTEFVADFLGISNLITAEAQPAANGCCHLRVGEFTLTALVGETNLHGPVKCVVRPERVKLEPYDSGGEGRVPGIVERLVYLGSATRVIVHLATGQTLQSLIQSDGDELPYEQGTAVQVHLPADAVRVLARSDQAVVSGESGVGDGSVGEGSDVELPDQRSRACSEQSKRQATSR